MARLSFEGAVKSLKEEGYDFQELLGGDYKYSITKGNFVECFKNGREVVSFFRDTHPKMFRKATGNVAEKKANKIAVEYALPTTTNARKDEIQREMYELLTQHDKELHEETRSMIEQMCHISGGDYYA